MLIKIVRRPSSRLFPLENPPDSANLNLSHREDHQGEKMSLIKDEVSGVMKGSVSLVQEFKAFISRGNVVDLAVGVIIGGAFGAITTSLVKDVVMPPISYMM